MNRSLQQNQTISLLDDAKTMRKIEFNLKKNKEQDNGPALDELAKAFDYRACRDEYWNPEASSLLYGTPLWDESTPAQRVKLNQLYWVAYYCQIISAEIATIFFNQTSAAGMYGIEDFRPVCDSLDLESLQERAHINVFKKIAEDFELEEFGERLFTYPMRTPYVETMIYHNTNRVKEFWKKIQLNAFTLLSSGNAFIGCQYFSVRGLRTLNGKIVQHKLSQYYSKHQNKEAAPIPSLVSYYHFLDESFHFNTSLIVGKDVVNSLKAPTRFEKAVVNRMIAGVQRDHQPFSTAIDGIFWYDPALYPTIYRLLRSKIFNMDATAALSMMDRCFTQENEGMHKSLKTHQIALASYREYASGLPFLVKSNQEMSIMAGAGNKLEKHLEANRRGMRAFRRKQLLL